MASLSGQNSKQEDDEVLLGPDLNSSRTPLDKKLYRQILLPNGLRAVLVQDTVAMHQSRHHEHDDDEMSTEEGEVDGKLECHSDDEEEEEDEGLRDAAAAMLVGVGSMHDPIEAQGLAHFLEHMLFMGTEKYPTENAFDSFLSKHGGSDNAYTEFEYTVYHLEIPQSGLFQALDMMAQFFIHPLLLEDAVERELKAIESEFQLSKNSDNCRLLQLMCHTSGNTVDEHPFAKFSWGNLQSLKEIPEKNKVDMMKELRKFYNQYYYASNMRLVVVGAYTLDKLEEHVVRSFSDVPSAPREPSPFAAKHQDKGTWNERYHSAIAKVGVPLQPSSLGKIFRVVPVKDFHSLHITWQVPPQSVNWRSKPCDYIAHLVGHEAVGSLLSSLKEKSWATGLHAGVGQGLECTSAFSLFSLTINLSEDGVSQWPAIVREVYMYIGMLRYYYSLPTGLPEWIFEELSIMHHFGYQYANEDSSEALVEDVAENMAPHRALPAERLLDGNELLFEHDADLVKDLLDNYLTPTNARVDLISSTFGRSSDFAEDDNVEETSLSTVLDLNNVDEDSKFDTMTAGTPHVEPHFGTRFWCHSIPPSVLSEWQEAVAPCLPPLSSSISLPPLNPFLPKNFDLRPLPPDDCHHPLLHCSMKICVTVGKRKSWFPATVTKFNSIKNQILLSYEDEDEKWHKVDLLPSDLNAAALAPNFEGTLDDKELRYRIVAVAMEGKGAVLKFGDDNDHHVEDGFHFPPIPPALPESRLPQLVSDTPVLKMWHLQDRKFKRPIADLRIRIICEEANRTPFHRACADLFSRLFGDAATETSYLASMCELESSIESTDVGFGLRVHGFDDKLMDLAEFCLKLLFSFRGRGEKEGLPAAIKPDRFDACLEVLKRSYANKELKASSLSSAARLRCLRENHWSPHAKAMTLRDISVPSFVRTISTILSKISLECLYHGNVDLSDADVAKTLLLDLINGSGGGGLQKKNYPQFPIIKVPLTENHDIIVLPTKDPKEPNTAVEMYFQIGVDDLVERVMIDLLVQILDEPLFDQVRTKSSFGYSVSCDSRWTHGVMGIHFRVVTSTKSAAKVTERIDQFLLEYRKTLEDMSQDDFMEHLVALAKNKLLMDTSLAEECDHLWGEIEDRRYDWEVRRNETVCLRTITKESVVACYDKWLLPACSDGKARKRRSIAVQVIGTSDGPASMGRPLVDASDVGQLVDENVLAFHKLAGNATWGKNLLNTRYMSSETK